MKIVHICLTGPYTEGLNYQENVLSKYHHIFGYEVTIIATQWRINNIGMEEKVIEDDYVNSYGVKVRRLCQKNENKTVNYKWRRFPKLKKSLQEEKPDIIFIHNLQLLDLKIIAQYAKEHEVTIYADNHADFSNSARSTLARLLYRLVWKQNVKILDPYVKCYYGVLPSRVDFLIDVYGVDKDKCKLLVMGADDELLEKTERNNERANIRKKHSINDDDFLIVTGGKIDLFKTQTIMLMEAVKNKDESIKLIVFGSIVPELKDKVENLIDGKKIIYVGWLTQEDSYKYFAAADLACFPGRHSVYWEQVVAQGIPMLCKRWDGTTHVDIGGNVKFLEEDSAESIAKALDEIVGGEYQSMYKAAKSDKRNKFRYSGIAKESIETV